MGAPTKGAHNCDLVQGSGSEGFAIRHNRNPARNRARITITSRITITIETDAPNRRCAPTKGMVFPFGMLRSPDATKRVPPRLEHLRNAVYRCTGRATVFRGRAAPPPPPDARRMLLIRAVAPDALGCVGSESCPVANYPPDAPRNARHKYLFYDDQILWKLYPEHSSGVTSRRNTAEIELKQST